LIHYSTWLQILIWILVTKTLIIQTIMFQFKYSQKVSHTYVHNLFILYIIWRICDAKVLHGLRNWETVKIELISKNVKLWHYFRINCILNIDSYLIMSGYLDIGYPIMQCKQCQAMMWYGERMLKHRHGTNPKFSLCCGNDKVQLPLLQTPPPLL